MAFVPVPPPPPPKFRENKRAVLVNSGLNTKEMGEGKKKNHRGLQAPGFSIHPKLFRALPAAGHPGRKKHSQSKIQCFRRHRPENYRSGCSRPGVAAAPPSLWQLLGLFFAPTGSPRKAFLGGGVWVIISTCFFHRGIGTSLRRIVLAINGEKSQSALKSRFHVTGGRKMLLELKNQGLDPKPEVWTPKPEGLIPSLRFWSSSWRFSS